MSIQPGVQQHCEIEGARGISLRTGTVGSVTQDGMTPVEYGRVAAASKYTTTASSGDPLVPELVFGPVATVTITGTTSGKADGTITGAATVGGMGSGATVTYTVASNVASGGTVAAGGTGYAVGDVISVSDDPGVTFTIATLS